MAKKNKNKQEKEVQNTPKKAPEQKNHKVLLILMGIGIFILLFLLIQSQTTIQNQRNLINEQQQQITALEEKVTKLEEVSAQTILDDTGQLIIEKGAELIEEILTPQQ